MIFVTFHNENELPVYSNKQSKLFLTEQYKNAFQKAFL